MIAWRHFSYSNGIRNIDKNRFGGENMYREGCSMANTIRNDNDLMLKLSSTSLLMAAAKAKVENYMKIHFTVFQEMKEDEEAMALFNLYYEENEDNLKAVASESLLTSFEAEKLISEYLEQYEG